jgi:hypothetical protein
MNNTGFIPFFSERDKLGRILVKNKPNNLSPLQREVRDKKRLRQMWGSKLNRTMAKNCKPKLSIANDLVSWINTG